MIEKDDVTVMMKQNWQLELIFLVIVWCCHGLYAEDKILSPCAIELQKVMEYIQNGGDPNSVQLTEEAAKYRENNDVHTKWGDNSMLGEQVSLGCIESVQYLLENGADPNQYHGNLTPLIVCFMTLEETRNIENDQEREQTINNLLKIRDLLIAYGGVVNWAVKDQRSFIQNFRNFLMQCIENRVFVYVMEDFLVFDGSEVYKKFSLLNDQVHAGDKILSVDQVVSLRKQVLSEVRQWAEQYPNQDLCLAFISSENKDGILSIVRTNLARMGFQVHAIGLNRAIPCDPKTVINLFLESENVFTASMIDLLNKECPPPRISPYSPESEEYMLTTSTYR